MISNIVFVQSGQCGNQVGFEVLDLLFSHLRDSDEKDVFFRESVKSGKIYSRAVCLDTEPKVIQSCLQNRKADGRIWNIDSRSAAYRHGGAGNNWALGYSMFSGEFMDLSIDMVRRELECCDMPPTLLSVHSVAGGTGSGVGAHVSEALRDYFNDVTRLTLAIFPYHFGEVVVQNYNAILSLSKIASASHAVILFENEVAHDLCLRTKSIERPSIQDINRIIAANVVPVLLPKYSKSGPESVSDDIIHLCSHPGYRILDIKTVPQTSDASVDFTCDSWQTLVKSTLRMQTLGLWSEIGMSKLLSATNSTSKASATIDINRNKQKNIIRSSINDFSNRIELRTSLGAVLTLRGNESREVIEEVEAMIDQSMKRPVTKRKSSTSDDKEHGLLSRELHDAPPLKVTNAIDNPLKVCFNDDHCNRYERSASILSNSQAILPVLERSVSNASGLFDAKAYVHQYHAHGVNVDDFLKAFRDLGQIIQNYRHLSD